MKAVIAPVKNISRFSSALESVIGSTRDERMVLVHGATGVGKSTALAYFLNRYNAIYVEASPAWSLGSMYRSIVLAMGQMPKGRAADMEQQIVDEMMGAGRPLFIDELDYLFLPGQTTSLRMLEALHSIHDKSRMPIAMVGMEKIDRRLHQREQIYRRIFQKVQFSDLDRDDVRVTADSLCTIRIADDLLDRIFTHTQGRMARIINILAKVERRAKVAKWDVVDTGRWGDRPWTEE